jgi:hypothetical protein
MLLFNKIRKEEGETMKKIVIIISIAAMFISSCSVIEKFTPADPTTVPPTPIPTATATPDPCASENLLEEVEKVQDLVNTFQDLAYLTAFTQNTELILPIMEMQAIRRDLQKLDVPDCEEAVKTASINYMNSTINYLVFFMGGNTEDVEAGIQNSQILWQVVLGEFNKLLTTAGLVSEELPNIGNAVPQTTDSSFFVGNDGPQRVNVRSQPNLNADIISQFEPGMQAIGLARNESGDWLQINLNSVIGWVNTEMVTTSAAVEELPISDPTQ